MFFYHELERVVTLHPSFFGPSIHKYIIHQLMNDVEGTNTGSYYVVCVMDSAIEVSEGKLLPGTGYAEYTVHYKAVIWRPFKGEVLDGIVSSVIESGFFVDIGPLTAFVSVAMINGDVSYDGNATPPQWTNNDDITIEKGSHCRVKVKGIRSEVDRMFAIATIKEDFLGPLS